MILKNTTSPEGIRQDIWMKEGKIFALGQGLSTPGEEVLDCEGLVAMPAFVDTHCHWRTPGLEYKEDIATGSAAAAAGGYTFVNLMPNTKPVCSSAAQAHAVMDQAKALGVCDCNQTVSITKDFDGKTIDHLKTLPQDVKFITEDGKGVMSNQVMAKVFAIAAQRELCIMSHAEEMEISPWDYRLAENLETVRNLHLCEYYGARLHLCHVSTKEAIQAVTASKYKGAPVTCEVTPHHIWFTQDTCQYKVNPPIREQEDVNALVQAIMGGMVDCIATDHAPHTPEDKEKGAAGMVGLETAFSVCFTKLCVQCGLPLAALSELMSTSPAALLGLTTKGRIAPGYDADIVLVDTEADWVVDASKLHSKSKNTPFEGQTLSGRVMATFKAGVQTYQYKD